MQFLSWKNLQDILTEITLFFHIWAHCARGSQVEDVGQGGVFELPIFWHKFEGVELYALAYLGDMPPDF